ncbi:hypothetical protein HBDW_35100 [Herbaspirillum sp. DW155]|uniref:hypothetical protein n=1 Tax=Herbaspirillum sp. DW155 TaxID=3095609 RepID=UPI00309030BA|nr:hypothetical protein HBDW_35100 [Herbaspirillum sp. DW155]
MKLMVWKKIGKLMVLIGMVCAVPVPSVKASELPVSWAIHESRFHMPFPVQKAGGKLDVLVRVDKADRAYGFYLILVEEKIWPIQKKEDLRRIFYGWVGGDTGTLPYPIRTHFINRREMRSVQKGRWQGARRVVWRCHTQGAQRGQRPFWTEPGGSGPFGRIAALRIWVKTPSLDPNSRLALHPKRDSLALTPIYEMGSRVRLKIDSVDPENEIHIDEVVAERAPRYGRSVNEGRETWRAEVLFMSALPTGVYRVRLENLAAVPQIDFATLFAFEKDNRKY